MLDASIINKRVIAIDLAQSNSISLDLVDNIRNVLAIKLLKVYIETTSNPDKLSIYYLHINDYNVLDIYDDSGNNKQAFLAIPFDPNNSITNSSNHKIIVANYSSVPTSDYRNDPDCYMANPLISNLSKLSINLVDINGTPLSNIKKFFVEIVVYSQFAKLTMD